MIALWKAAHHSTYKTVRRDQGLFSVWHNCPTETASNATEILCTVYFLLFWLPAMFSGICDLGDRRDSGSTQTALYLRRWGFRLTHASCSRQLLHTRVHRDWEGKHWLNSTPDCMLWHISDYLRSDSSKDRGTIHTEQEATDPWNMNTSANTQHFKGRLCLLPWPFCRLQGSS